MGTASGLIPAEQLQGCPPTTAGSAPLKPFLTLLNDARTACHGSVITTVITPSSLFSKKKLHRSVPSVPGRAGGQWQLLCPLLAPRRGSRVSPKAVGGNQGSKAPGWLCPPSLAALCQEVLPFEALPGVILPPLRSSLARLSPRCPHLPIPIPPQTSFCRRRPVPASFWSFSLLPSPF